MVDYFLTQCSSLGLLFFCFSVFLDESSTCVLSYFSINFSDFQGNETRSSLNILEINSSQCPFLFTTRSFSHFPCSVTSSTTLWKKHFPKATYLLHE
jgi:hypothetical protein